MDGEARSGARRPLVRRADEGIHVNKRPRRGVEDAFATSVLDEFRAALADPGPPLFRNALTLTMTGN